MGFIKLKWGYSSLESKLRIIIIQNTTSIFIYEITLGLTVRTLKYYPVGQGSIPQEGFY